MVGSFCLLMNEYDHIFFLLDYKKQEMLPSQQCDRYVSCGACFLWLIIL